MLSANDAARYLAGLPILPDPQLSPAQDPTWQAHARAMNQALCNSNSVSSIISGFSGPRISRRSLNRATLASTSLVSDFVCRCHVLRLLDFVLQGLEPLVPLPDRQRRPAMLAGTLQNIEISLNTILSFSFFKTKICVKSLAIPFKGVLPATVFLHEPAKR